MGVLLLFQIHQLVLKEIFSLSSDLVSLMTLDHHSHNSNY